YYLTPSLSLNGTLIQLSSDKNIVNSSHRNCAVMNINHISRETNRHTIGVIFVNNFFTHFTIKEGLNIIFHYANSRNCSLCTNIFDFQKVNELSIQLINSHSHADFPIGGVAVFLISCDALNNPVSLT